ncbi:MAG: spore coat protein CotJB [Firmicutes bacterium]|nr:spore coat protein CotJB [Bacillota bacterium]
MSQEQMKLLELIQALEFTALDLNLYLDTHPDDHQALLDFNVIVSQLNAAKRDYETRYGPLTNYGHSPSPRAWKWIDDPWPWEV